MSISALLSRVGFKPVLIAASTSFLVACGGGGGGGVVTPPVNAATWAVSGSYSPVLKIQGNVSASPLSAALSLVHSANPGVEYVMDASATPASLGVTLQRGSYDSGSQKFTNLSPVAYVDTPNNSVRVTSLLANGQRPVQQQVAAKALCPEVVEAFNFSDPSSSRIAVVVPGGDGICGSADDEQWQISLTSSYQPIFSFFLPGRILGYLSSPTTGQPTAWLDGAGNGRLELFPFGAGASKFLNSAISPSPAVAPVYKSVLNLNDLILFTQDGALRSVKGSLTSATLSDLSALTGPDGWKSAGYDADNAYVYLNSSTANSGAGGWRILSVSRSTQGTTTVATGIGSIVAADTAGQGIFITLLSGPTPNLARVSTTNGTQTIAFLARNTATSQVAAGPNGTNILISSSTLTDVSPSTSVISSTGGVLYTAASGLLYGADQNQYDPVSGSYVFSSYLIATPFGSAGFSGSSLVRFDTDSLGLRTLGVFPGGADLGGFATEQVFISPLLPNGGFGGTSASRVISGQVQVTGSAVYTYNTGVANSLTKTTVQVR